MTAAMTEQEAFEAGDLSAWRAALAAKVKENPASAARRLDFADALLVIGDYEKAELHYDLAGQEGVKGMRAQVFRRLLRGMVARDAWWEEGAMPELAGEPDDGFRLLIEAIVTQRSGKDASDAFEAAEEARTPVAGLLNGEQVTDLRDTDDRMGSLLEFLTPAGDYMLAPMSSVVHLKCEPIQSVSDLILRRAEAAFTTGRAGTVFLPMIYPHSADTSDLHKLGRGTDWNTGQTPVTAEGQRCFIAGDDVISLGEIEAFVPETADDA